MNHVISRVLATPMQDQDGRVTLLRQVLEVAKGKLEDQDRVLKQLTSSPVAYGVVLEILGKLQKVTPASFKIGTRVKISRKSPYAHQSFLPGTVKALKGAWVAVEFDDGKKQSYRNGLIDPKDPQTDDGMCDLILEEHLRLVVAYDHKKFEVEYPDGMTIECGDVVKLNQSMYVIGVEKDIPIVGDVAVVRRIIDARYSEIEYMGVTKTVINSRLQQPPEVGDRVTIDDSSCVIMANLGKQDDRFNFAAATGVKWDDIGGLEEAKEQLIEAIELPYRHKGLYERYKKKPIKGVALYGPPGCGKTMLGKAVATALAEAHQSKGASSGFIYIKGPEILERWVGSAETTIRSIFAQARKHKDQHGYPAVIFIDEADALLGERGKGISSDMERTIVPAFLAEMDGLDVSAALVIIATNRVDTLDSAITRDGRIDRKIKVSRPDKKACLEIFKLYLNNIPLNNGSSVEEIAKACIKEVFSKDYCLYNITRKGDYIDKTVNFTLANLVSGALIAGIVDQATSLAVKREIESSDPADAGLTRNDLIKAVKIVFKQNLGLNHKRDLADFTQDYQHDVESITRVKQVAE